MTAAATPPSRPWIGMLVGSQRRMASSAAVAGAVRAEVAEARRGGIGVFVVPEHLDATPYTMLGAVPLTGALAPSLDSDVTLVVSVVAGLTDPATVRRDLATVDAVGAPATGLAVMAGYHRDDFAAGGHDYARRFERRWQLLEEMSAASAGPSPWLWCAASTTATAARAASLGVAWYGGPGLSVAHAAALADTAGGSCVLRRDVLVGPDAAAVAAGLRTYITPKYQSSAEWGYRPPSGGSVIAGTAAEAARALDEVADRVRPAGVVLRMCWPDMAAETGLSQVRAVVDEVLPRLDAFGEAA